MKALEGRNYNQRGVKVCVCSMCKRKFKAHRVTDVCDNDQCIRKSKIMRLKK